MAVGSLFRPGWLLTGCSMVPTRHQSSQASLRSPFHSGLDLPAWSVRLWRPAREPSSRLINEVRVMDNNYGRFTEQVLQLRDKACSFMRVASMRQCHCNDQGWTHDSCPRCDLFDEALNIMHSIGLASFIELPAPYGPDNIDSDRRSSDGGIIAGARKRRVGSIGGTYNPQDKRRF